MNLICTSECIKCIYGTLDSSDKSKAKIICSVKQREYYYGQKVPCENFTKKRNEE